MHVAGSHVWVKATKDYGQLETLKSEVPQAPISRSNNPSFLLWFQESDIVTCLLRRKDGPLLSFIFCWIITLSFFIWPFITDLSVFLSVYTTVPVSHSLSTQGWTHWSHMQSFLPAPMGLSGEWSFSNLEQILNSWPEPYQRMHLISP